LLSDAQSVTAARGKLRDSGIDARPFWKPVHLQPPYAEAPRTPMSVADSLWGRVLTLPCSTGLSAGDQDRVISVLREILS
jgi:dTDP-4-amino-4,6-dideoxygalactose transaminase